MSLDRLGLPLLRQLDPETAHKLALMALRTGLGPRRDADFDPVLRCQIAGLDLPNPLGLAAGFDKDAVALHPLSRCGFGWLEVGAVTPRPQAGNPRPRLFRLPEDGAAINRFGFNNAGVEAILPRLASRPGGIIGINLGANKDSADRAGDFAKVLQHCGPYVDFATVNVSSPNTEKLRALQSADALDHVLTRVQATNEALETPIPIFLKIAPDLDLAALAAITKVAEKAGISAIVATNTTVGRKGLRSAKSKEIGGLSGAPLFEPSTRVLAQLSGLTALPLIGVGGIASAEQAYAKIKAGASALQLYTGLAYHGMGLVPEILTGLADLLRKDGYATISEAIGSDREAFL